MVTGGSTAFRMDPWGAVERGMQGRSGGEPDGKGVLDGLMGLGSVDNQQLPRLLGQTTEGFSMGPKALGGWVRTTVDGLLEGWGLWLSTFVWGILAVATGGRRGGRGVSLARLQGVGAIAWDFFCVGIGHV